MNEEPEPRKHSDPTPQISDPEQMPASLGVIEQLHTQLHKLLEGAEAEGGLPQIAITVDKDNAEIQQLFPGVYRLAIVENNDQDIQLTNLYLYYEDSVVEYGINLHHKSGLMEIDKLVDVTDDKPVINVDSYDSKEEAILDWAKSRKKEADLGLSTVNLKEARNLSTLLDLVVPK